MASPTSTIEEAIAALSAHFGDRLLIGYATRMEHGAGEGMRDPVPPDAVLMARTTQDVADAVRICSANRFPVIAHGAGTSLEGHLQAVMGGLSIDVSLMHQVLEVNSDDLDCRVQAGITRETLNRHLRADGLFFPVDPGANASIGGMAATRASGTNAVRYGTMKDVVLGLTVVTAAGEVIRTGTRARKSSAGYDLTRLFVGSEGTLGIITEVQLRLFGIPEEIVSAVCQFDTLKGAIESSILIMQIGVPIARMELLDATQMKASISWSKLDDLEEKPTLFFEFHGSKAGLAEQTETVMQITHGFGGQAFRWASLVEDRNRLWKARHDAWFAARALKVGSEAFATDACVPISRLADCILESRAEADKLGLLATVIGHVGDGNFHMLVLYDPDDRAEYARAEELAQSVASRAIRMGGTSTGEHGIGLHKLDRMFEEHGPALGAMTAIKRALDPNNILNPGKTVPFIATRIGQPPPISGTTS